MIDFSIDRCVRGHHIGSQLLLLGLQVMEKHWGPGIEAVAEVHAINRQAMALVGAALSKRGR